MMNRTITNKLNMYHRVSSAMSDYQPTWQSVPALLAAVNKFNTKLDLLDARVIEQAGATTGVGLEKQLRSQELRELMLVVERTLMLHGLAIGDIILQTRNSHSVSDLVKMNFNNLVVRCAELKADIDAFGDQLGDFAINDKILQILPLLQSVEELKNSAWKAILKRKGATQSIRDLSHELDAILNVELDNLMLPFKTNEFSFFQAFTNARMVFDYHYAHGPKVPKEPDDGRMEG